MILFIFDGILHKKAVFCSLYSDCVALNIPIGQWHSVEALESGMVILETKDGQYEPLGPEDILSVNN